MSDYGRIGDYIGPVAAKKLSAVDIDANSSNQHEFGGNDALRRLLGTGEDRRASTRARHTHRAHVPERR